MKKIICVVVIIIGLFITISSFIMFKNIKLPNRVIDSPISYVGGDAYNYIIESSIVGGEIAGGKTSKTICFTNVAIGLLITSLGLLKFSETIKEE